MKRKNFLLGDGKVIVAHMFASNPCALVLRKQAFRSPSDTETTLISRTIPGATGPANWGERGALSKRCDYVPDEEIFDF